MIVTDLLEKTFYPLFTRRYLHSFTANDLKDEFYKIGVNLSNDDVLELLDSDPNVISLEQNTFITRAGAFTGRYFSFVPTAQEVEQGVIIAGDRCVPFVDPDRFYFNLNFSVNGQLLEKKILTTNSNNSYDLFTLLGDPVFHIGNDPANEELHIIDNGYELPSKFYLSGFDVSELFKQFDFKVGDRIIAYVSNWDLGIVDIFPLKAYMEKCPEKYVVFSDYEIARREWHENFENAMLKSFERLGPCSNIDEQLEYIFYDNRNKLCVPLCGSVHEYLDKTDKVDIEYFGVEPRLWRKNEEVPADNNGSFDEIILPFYEIPDYLIDCLAKDILFTNEQNKSQNDKKSVLKDLFDNINDCRQKKHNGFVERLFANTSNIDIDELEKIKLQIENRSVKLRKYYNWFADFAFGAFRHRSLELYSDTRELFFDLECSKEELKKLPQVELVVLAQIYNHVSGMLQAVSEYGIYSDNGEMYNVDEFKLMQDSLDVLEFNLEDIKPILLDAYEKIKRERFSLV